MWAPRVGTKHFTITLRYSFHKKRTLDHSWDIASLTQTIHLKEREKSTLRIRASGLLLIVATCLGTTTSAKTQRQVAPIEVVLDANEC